MDRLLADGPTREHDRRRRCARCGRSTGARYAGRGRGQPDHRPRLPAARGGATGSPRPTSARRLLAALPARDRAIWATAMYAGLRRGELMALASRTSTSRAGVIHVRRGWDATRARSRPKSGKDRTRADRRGAARHLDEHLLGLDWQEGLVFGMSASEPVRAARAIAKRAEAHGARRGSSRSRRTSAATRTPR